MAPNPPERPPSVAHLLGAATAVSNTLSQAVLAPHGLTHQQWTILSAVWAVPNLAISDLAAYTGTNAPATSRIIDRMSAKGLVQRTADDQDRRTVRVTSGPEGDKLRHLASLYETLNTHLLRGFTGDEVGTLITLLDRVENNARDALEDVTASR